MIGARSALVALTWSLVAASVVYAGGPGPAKARGEATMPLGEILELYRARDVAQRSPAPPPPIGASLVGVELDGHLEDDALAVRGRFEVRVLRDDGWSRVRLLETGPSTVIAALPAVEHGALVLDGPFLAFVTDRPGRYVLDIGFVEKAQRNGGRRRVELGVLPAAVATLDLTVDEARHALIDPTLATPRADGTRRLYPEGGRFLVAWAEDGDDTEGEGLLELARPRIDTVIPRAHASIVSTLEGRAVHRVLYELRFAGTEGLAVTIPDGQHLEKLFVNGAPTPFEVDERGRTEIEVTSERVGQQEGRVELVLSSDLGRFNLSGQLRFELPRAQWPIHELDLTAHLPEVFNYARRDGSLEPAAAVPDTRYSYGIPLPGKALAFHQFLIDGSAPHVNVDYTIDLTGRTFR